MNIPPNLRSHLRPLAAWRPHWAVRSPDVQTILSRRLPPHLMDLRRLECPVLVDAGFDCTGYQPNTAVRLLGYYTRHIGPDDSRGLVLTLHGWEGNSHSNYNLVTADALLRAGYDVFRLNLRDHGPGYHVDPYALNRGMFLGTLIDEAARAVRRVAELAGPHPFFIVGPSMGGNFALRLAACHAHSPFHNLTHVVAINPVINPARSTDALDVHLIYRNYFRSRWLDSLHAKQRLFPDTYEFESLESIPSVRGMTEWLVRRYTTYADADEYFGAYDVAAATLAGLTVPVTIVTSRDDKIVPVVDFDELAPQPFLDLRIQPYGGHVGYVDIWPSRHLLPDMLLRILEGS